MAKKGNRSKNRGPRPAGAAADQAQAAAVGTALAESRQARRAEARKAGRPADAPGSPPARKSEPVPEPRFWFGFEVSWAKLSLARFVIFTILAIDSLLQISH